MMCDLCNVPIGPAGGVRIPGQAVQNAVRHGFDPIVDPAIDMSSVTGMALKAGFSREQIAAAWRAGVMNDPSDWNLCAACGEVFLRFQRTSADHPLPEGAFRDPDLFGLAVPVPNATGVPLPLDGNAATTRIDLDRIERELLAEERRRGLPAAVRKTAPEERAGYEMGEEATIEELAGALQIDGGEPPRSLVTAAGAESPRHPQAGPAPSELPASERRHEERLRMTIERQLQRPSPRESERLRTLVDRQRQTAPSGPSRPPAAPRKLDGLLKLSARKPDSPPSEVETPKPAKRRSWWRRDD